MLLSQKHNILYVANPKTATTALQKWLLNEDPSFKKGKHNINDNQIMLHEHITAQQAKQKLGESFYNKLNVFTFIRHPYSKLISGYNFYKGGGKSKSLLSKDTKNSLKRKLHSFQILLARIFPFWLWALLYPYKDNLRFCIDKNNQNIVQHIGIYENLNEDMSTIIKNLRLDINIDKLQKVNISKTYISNTIFENIFYKKLLLFRHPNLKKDLDFYKRVASENKKSHH